MNISLKQSGMMFVTLFAGLVFTMLSVSYAEAGKPDTSITRIQDGTLLDSSGAPITMGVNEWGYNYQARMFNGKYCDSYRDAAWCQSYKDINLSMKWNDAWLANTDADGDLKLDRHHGYDTFRGSGAWLTNHQSGVNEDGSVWTYFTKIVAAPDDAFVIDGVWYAADGTEIGPVIWGQFAIIMTVSNDSAYDEHGVQYLSPMGPGFGKF